MSAETIVVRGARVHNLKNVDFEIPHLEAAETGHLVLSSLNAPNAVKPLGG